MASKAKLSVPQVVGSTTGGAAPPALGSISLKTGSKTAQRVFNNMHNRFHISSHIALDGKSTSPEEDAKVAEAYAPNPNLAQFRSAAPPGCSLPPRPTTLSASPMAAQGDRAVIPSAAATMKSLPAGTVTTVYPSATAANLKPQGRRLRLARFVQGGPFLSAHKTSTAYVIPSKPASENQKIEIRMREGIEPAIFYVEWDKN
ncbi:hypothetical protein B0T26DRAFT_678713 [Lasiosphaeria miniovina]|uniref:Uncharacterized protein n=1 Tax=Lasiosphaeria miniovina TaxID=1954250 RepID=A0AA40DQ93_9PEZI|nr:uncharacterized protein B0T26DRAFT_678713 [Lasiosphaeria miniovina]KAK0709267.1 hypothetical protein B0T26DRAFT_678713 [Lasiosphaeria miniovina]